MIYFDDIIGKAITGPTHINAEGKLRLTRIHARDVYSVQADGDELECLYKLIPELPKVNKRVVRFPMPWAQLIAINLTE